MRAVLWLTLWILAGTVFAASSAQRFIGMDVPGSHPERSAIYTTAAVEPGYGDHVRQPLSFHPLIETGSWFGNVLVGGLVDAQGRPLLDHSRASARPLPYLSGMPDGSTLLSPPKGLVAFAGVRSQVHLLLTQFESVTRDRSGKRPRGRLPMSLALTVLAEDAVSGQLHAISYRPLDMSSIGGLWTPCAAGESPWGTHLGGEEYEPDARIYERDPDNSAVTGMQRLYGLPADSRSSAYGYGHLFEVAIDKHLQARSSRRYAMGRFSHEIAVVMPDQRTVYMTDDHDQGVLFMFVADRKSDLSSGTLYAARWYQMDASAGGRARLGWLRLGHASDKEVAGWVATTAYSDIFNGDQLRPAKARQAAFLESRRYARLLGATAEFNKMEGVAFDADGRRLFLAISRIGGGMLVEKKRVNDHIRLLPQPTGAI